MSTRDLPSAPDRQAAAGRRARAGWVYLVGAGPGDPGLLTQRGAELVASADLVIYGEPTPVGLLATCRPDAELRSLGPRGQPRPDADHHHAELAHAIVAAAHAGRSVVRLHGGDPGFFSRGVALAAELDRAGVPFQVVPGVCAPLAAAAYAGLPLTLPGQAERLTFVRAGGDAPNEWAGLARGGGTVCVLRAERDLPAICAALRGRAGYARETPVALIVSASLPTLRTFVATLGELPGIAGPDACPGPALLVVGPGVPAPAARGWFERQPLFGQQVLVLRPVHQADATVALLAARGATALRIPALAIVPPPDAEPLRRAVACLGSYDLVAFTSENGVVGLWRELRRQGRDARAFGRAAIAAIGPGTAAALGQRGIVADVVPTEFVAEALAAAILRHLGAGVRGARVLLPRAVVARDVLPDALGRAGAHVDVVPTYRSVPGYTAAQANELRAALAQGEIDWIMLTASSTVGELLTMVGPTAAELLAGTRLASIGPVTTATAERQGLRVAVTAAASTIEGLVDAMEATSSGEAT